MFAIEIEYMQSYIKKPELETKHDKELFSHFRNIVGLVHIITSSDKLIKKYFFSPIFVL